MSEPLPDEVLAHILEVQARKESELPPKNAFTAKQYYDILVEQLKESGVKEEQYPRFDTVRRKLREDETLNKLSFSNTFYYWQNGESTPAKKED